MRNQIEIYILSELKKLSQLESSISFQTIEDEIFKSFKTKRFRKYHACESLLKSIKDAIDYNVSNNFPINITFLQGCYKLWRLEESPEADWAELFALMHYIRWVKPILSIYKPGVIIDFYVDDLIMERISNYTREELLSYQNSFQNIIDFIKSYCPENLHFKITTVSSRFVNETDFWNKLNIAIEKQEKPENMKLNESISAMIDLNYRPLPNGNLDIFWREKLMQIHNAHSVLEERMKYREAKGKILAMPHHYSGSETRLFVGSTKASIVKYWIGVGAIKTKGNQFIQTVLSPKQLASSKFTIQRIEINGLEAKNFKQIRVLNN
jgi:hypothetical protein